MDIEKIRQKRTERRQTLSKNSKHLELFVYMTPYGAVKLSVETERRLDAVSLNWRTNQPYAYCNGLVKQILDEVTKAAETAYVAGTALEVY